MMKNQDLNQNAYELLFILYDWISNVMNRILPILLQNRKIITFFFCHVF